MDHGVDWTSYSSFSRISQEIPSQIPSGKNLTFTFLCHFAIPKNPARNDLFKVNDRNTRTRCEIGSQLTIKKLERHHWRHSGVFIVNFEPISHLVLVFLLLILTSWERFTNYSGHYLRSRMTGHVSASLKALKIVKVA